MCGCGSCLIHGLEEARTVLGSPSVGTTRDRLEVYIWFSLGPALEVEIKVQRLAIMGQVLSCLEPLAQGLLASF